MTDLVTQRIAGLHRLERLRSVWVLIGAIGLAVAGFAGVLGGTLYDLAGPQLLFTLATVLMLTVLMAARVQAARPSPAGAPAPAG